jgi:integrase
LAGTSSGYRGEAWLFPAVTLDTPIRRDNIWRRCMLPRLNKIGLEWATFQVMRRTFATLSKQAGVDAHTRSAQMGNTVDVNENEYAVSSFEDRLAAVRKLEATVIQ